MAELKPQRYAVVNQKGVAINVVMWDGKTPYDPGEGLELVLDEKHDGEYAIPVIDAPQEGQ